MEKGRAVRGAFTCDWSATSLCEDTSRLLRYNVTVGEAEIECRAAYSPVFFF